MRSTTSRNSSSSPLHPSQLRTSTSDKGVFGSSVSGFRGLLVLRAVRDSPETISMADALTSNERTPSDNKATTTSAIQGVDTSATSIAPAAPSSTAHPLSDKCRAGATATLSRRKNPEAFESAAQLRDSIRSSTSRRKAPWALRSTLLKSWFSYTKPQRLKPKG